MWKRLGRPLSIPAMLMILVGLLALPAAADPPNIEGPFEDVFDAANPCTGEVEQHTIVFTAFDHFHSHNAVIQDKDRHGWTESGFVLHNGRWHVVEREDGFHVKLKDVWRHPDTGDKFQAVGVIRVVGNAPVIDEFTLECLTGPTILP